MEIFLATLLALPASIFAAWFYSRRHQYRRTEPGRRRNKFVIVSRVRSR